MTLNLYYDWQMVRPAVPVRNKIPVINYLKTSYEDL